MKTNLSVLLLLIAIFTSPITAKTYHVSTAGSDTNPGTEKKPFRTIQKAADIIKAGDKCYVHPGTYRETVLLKNSGQKGRPIRFIAADPGKVIIDGTEIINPQWSVHKGNIYKAEFKTSVPQLFVDRQMMIQARWPNASFDQLLDPNTWARTSPGSRYGKIIDPNLAKTNIDWTNSVAVLNIAHQFFSWTRPVRSATEGSDTLTYDCNLGGLGGFEEKTKPWEDDRYYLTGKLEALDTPTEWHFDSNSGTLYLWCPNSDNPSAHTIETKTRDYAFDANSVDYIELSGFDIFAAAIRLQNCNHCLLENCRILFSLPSHKLQSLQSLTGNTCAALIIGSNNTVKKCTIAYSPNNGLSLIGSDNLVEDCLIHDFCWDGSLTNVGLRIVQGTGNIARHNTIYNGGNALLSFCAKNSIIEYNHVYHGGRLCKDVALLYTQRPETSGSVIRYNWVHGCRTERTATEGILPGGLGIRGDDQTRNLTVHHNVVWDCGRDGIIVKGQDNRVYNNTVFDIGTKQDTGNYVNLHTDPEPLKPWMKQAPLLNAQNTNSQIFNNAALTITSNNKGRPFPDSPSVANNYRGKDLMLTDTANFDFRPKPGSPLIDAGRKIPGITDNYKGKAPDIGAYEFSSKKWTAGITWKQDNK